MRGAGLIIAVALAHGPPAWAQRVGLQFSETLTVEKSEVAYTLDLLLSAVSPTRIGVEALLDLRDLQRQLPELLAGLPLVDNCGARITLQRIDANAREAIVIVTGRLDVELFSCDRIAPTAWHRGTLEVANEVEIQAELSAELEGPCVVFRLHDVARSLPGSLPEVATGTGRREAARALLIEAVGLMLEDSPICPELPPDLEILDPAYESGSPSEIGDGGLGIALRGSIDVSTSTIVEILRLLQVRGVVPPRP